MYKLEKNILIKKKKQLQALATRGTQGQVAVGATPTHEAAAARAAAAGAAAAGAAAAGAAAARAAAAGAAAAGAAAPSSHRRRWCGWQAHTHPQYLNRSQVFTDLNKKWLQTHVTASKKRMSNQNKKKELTSGRCPRPRGAPLGGGPPARSACG